MLKSIWYNFRLPIKDPNRQLWINAITKHQIFSEVDDHTLSYRVCSLHFDPFALKHWKDRGRDRIQLVPGSCPMYFPNTNYLPNEVNTNNPADIMEIDENAVEIMEIDKNATKIISEKQRYILYNIIYVFIHIYVNFYNLFAFIPHLKSFVTIL